MRSLPLLLALSLAAAAGCGGNVVVDQASSSSTSTGGTMSSTSTVDTTSSSAPPYTCGGASATCTGDASSCNCNAPCNGRTYEVTCAFSLAAYVCSCSVNGDTVGACNTQSLSCDLSQGCCASVFGM